VVILACPKLLPLGTATFLAAPQTPLTWLTTSFAAAPQLPGEAHDTEVMLACPPVFRTAIPGAWRALPHVPFTWLTTNAEVIAALPPGKCPLVHDPAATQSPGDEHDTEMTSAMPAWFRAAMPGTSTAVPQVPSTWLTTNASDWQHGPPVW
jgi:hypothetical protein